MAERCLEICVDDPRGLEVACNAGADRIELCAALALGGLTPSPGLMAHAVDCPVPVYVMIRPRAGDFVYTPDEVRTMLADIERVHSFGLDGVVLGASLPDGRLDASVLGVLCSAAQGMGKTLHRAFDLVPDLGEALDIAVALGFERVLTSGGQRNVLHGLKALERIVALAGERITIMPGSGVTPANIGLILDSLDVREVHASASVDRGPVAGRAMELGFESADRRLTDGATVAALKQALCLPRD